MNEQPPSGDSAVSADGHETPRWVKVSLLVLAVAVVVVVVLLLAGGGPGGHGPGRHGVGPTADAPVIATV